MLRSRNFQHRTLLRSGSCTWAPFSSDATFLTTTTSNSSRRCFPFLDIVSARRRFGTGFQQFPQPQQVTPPPLNSQPRAPLSSSEMFTGDSSNDVWNMSGRSAHGGGHGASIGLQRREGTIGNTSRLPGLGHNPFDRSLYAQKQMAQSQPSRGEHMTHPQYSQRPPHIGARKITKRDEKRMREQKMKGKSLEDVQEVDENAITRAERFLRRSAQGEKEVHLERVRIDGVEFHKGHLTFLLRPNGPQCVAEGVARRKKQAITATFMHLARIIEASETPGFFSDENYDERVEFPLPIRLVEDERIRKKDLLRPGILRPPSYPRNSLNICEWDQYVRSCEKYLQTVYLTQLALGRIPLIGDRIVDEATIHCNDMRTDFKALMQLRRFYRLAGFDPPEEYTTTSVGPGMRKCSFVLPMFPRSFTAIGIGREKNIAQARAAMHAVEIIKRAKDVFPDFGGQASSTKSGGALMSTTATTEAREGTEEKEETAGAPRFIKVLPPAPPTPRWTPVVHHTREERSNLLDLYALCLDIPIPTFTFGYDRNTLQFSCELIFGDYRYTGRGTSRDNAEADAIRFAYEELGHSDERFQQIVAIKDKHPQLDPEFLVRLRLPPEVSQELGELVKSIKVESSDESADLESSIDGPTRVLINRISEHQTSGMNELRSRKMKEQLQRLHEDPIYISKFKAAREKLPIAHFREEFLQSIDSHRIVIVCGSTGCGKTTQIPQYLLDHHIEKGDGASCSIIATQPRRISAISIAERIASERRERVGETVGYTIRLMHTPGSSINLCTTGILLQMLVGSPSLDGLKYLIVDEIHERDINTDFILTLAKEVLEKNQELKLILMSATMHSELFANYFPGSIILNVEGRMFPVTEYFMEDIAAILRPHGVNSFMFNGLPQGNYQREETMNERSFSPVARHPRALPSSQSSRFGGERNPGDLDYGCLAHLIAYVASRMEFTDRSILVFLPGWKELVLTKDALQGYPQFFFVLLHSSIKSEDQLRAFEPAPPGMIKVVLATNIAESGITIDDVGAVIDTGSVKEMSWVQRQGTSQVGKAGQYSVSQLVTRFISQASCIQRKGRAGRTQGGECYRFLSRKHFESLPPLQTPEIHRQPLDSIILRALAMGYKDPKEILLKSIEAPPVALIDASMDLLRSIGAVDKDDRITSLGRYLSRLPATPRVGKMIMFGAILQCLDSALTLAAASEVDPFLQNRELRDEVKASRVDFAEESCSDHIAQLNAYNEFCANFDRARAFTAANFLYFPSLRQISKYKQQYIDILEKSGFLPRSLDSSSSDRRMRRNGPDDRPFVDSSEYSRFSDDIALVKGVICAGLFPNVAMFRQTRRKSKKMIKTIRTKSSDSIDMGSASVARQTKESDLFSPFFVFDQIMHLPELRKTFLTGTSMVNLWAILLFGASPAHLFYLESVGIGVIDEWILFQADKETITNVLALKQLLHQSMWKKFSHPDDVENNEHLSKIRTMCQKLVNTPLEGNEFTSKQWGEKGKVISPWNYAPPSGEIFEADD